MLPTVISIPDEIDIPARLLNRHETDRKKASAARQMVRWHGRRDVWVKSRSNAGTVYLTAQEMRRNIGRLAAMHCTHVCRMCKHGKLFDVEHIKAGESRRIFDLSL